MSSVHPPLFFTTYPCHSGGVIDLLPSRTVAVSLGDFSLHWYALMYLVAFAVAYVLLPRIGRLRNVALSRDEWLYVLTLSMAGVLIGGRLGYVLFYEPAYFWQQPLALFELWQGGMASHGGIIGVALALWYASRRLNINFLALTDVVVIPAALGLALGRLGNFINGELYGAHTALYAAAKNLLVAGLCLWVVRRYPAAPPGRLTALFLIAYSTLRLIIESWRVPIAEQIFQGRQSLLLTVLTLLIGVWLWRKTVIGNW